MPAEPRAANDAAGWLAVPSNVEAEASLLGAMMTPDMAWLIEYALDRIDSGSFHEPLHGRIFDAVARQHDLGKPATPVFVKGYLDGDETLAALGGNTYLARLTGAGDGIFIGRELVEQVADLANRRRVMAALRGAYEQCSDLNAGLVDIVGHVDAAINERQDDGIVETDAAGCMTAMLSDLDTEHAGVTCGRIETLDGLIGALEPKSLTILAARPGMGKTACAVSYAIGAARSGHGTCFVSLEMSREQLAGRMIADVGFDDPDARVPYTAIQKRSLNHWQRERVNEIACWIGKLPLTVVDAGTLTMSRMKRIVRSQKRQMAVRGQKLELVIVDYLQLLHPDERKRSAYEAISEISTRLKGLAKDENVAVMALAQLSRVVESRADKRPILSDLRDSGQIEQDADAVLFLLREEYYLKQAEPQNDLEAHEKWESDMDRVRGQIEFILAKRRNGETGTAWGQFFGAYQAVRG